MLKYDMNCKKCGDKLSGKQTSFCSPRCSRLFLKSEYRKRNKEKINAYNRKVRSLGVTTSGAELRKRHHHLRNNYCYACGSSVKLEVHHIKPRVYGGTNESFNLMLLCKLCHQKMEAATRSLWKRNVDDDTVTIFQRTLK